jgi:hypothetical protein
MDELTRTGIAYYGGAVVIGGLVWLLGGWRWLKRVLVAVMLILGVKSALVSPVVRAAKINAELGQIDRSLDANERLVALFGLASVVVILLTVRWFVGWMEEKEPAEEIRPEYQVNRPSDEEIRRSEADERAGRGASWTMDHAGKWNAAGWKSNQVEENYREGNEVEAPIGTRGGFFIRSPHDINAKGDRQRRTDVHDL